MQKTVLIFGATGNLGTELCKVFLRKGDAVIGLSRKTCDLTKEEEIARVVAFHKPNIIINAAAYNAVDAAEGEGKDLAYVLNAQAPHIIARAARDVGAAFVHLSSDYVFGGEEGEYVEDAVPNPLNAYGKSKAEGERLVQEACKDAYIVRTSKLFGTQGTSPDAKPSFVTMMAKLALTKPELSIVDEEIGCPTYTTDLADAIATLLDGAYAPGVYHLVNEDEGRTWFGFAEEIFDVLGVDPVRKSITGKDFPRPAPRAKKVVLKNTKGPKLPARRDALERFLRGPLKAGLDIRLTGIPGLFVMTPKKLGDERGWFSEVLNLGLLKNIGMEYVPVQVNEGQSLKGILRGMHFQNPPFAQTKIIACTAGRIFDVAIDIRKNSPTYGKAFGIELSAKHGEMLYVPQGFAHGMLALEDGSRIRYHIFGSGWEKSAEGGVRYNDPAFAIPWPEIDVPVVTNARDAAYPDFSEFKSAF